MRFNTIYRKAIRPAAVTLGVLVLAGCAAMQPTTPEQQVKQRANEYWQARIAGQSEKSYALTPPSYRKAHTKEQFARQFGNAASVLSAEVVGVKCEAEKCTARMKLMAKPAIIGIKLDAIDTYLDEVWISEDGQWWRYQDL
ncbi:hypothetical protein [Paracidovorax anthurii]|nr:hypothetical protein [Paracidovorax anthurii]